MNNSDSRLTFNVKRSQRILLLICISVLCLVVGAVFVAIVTGNNPTDARIRITAVIQDIVIFMIPAVGTAVMVTRRPADLLCLERPSVALTIAGIVALICSIPAMNALIAWNESLPMPDAFRAAESQAGETIAMLMGHGSVSGLIAGLLIVGLLAPLCEELYFRGCLQRILATSGFNVHAAVWISAIIFSAVHMQMAGFFPRLLLGAFFGYLVVWSGSVWTSVAAHAFNNIIAAISEWSMMRGTQTGIDHVGQDSTVMVAVSIVLTAVMIIAIYRMRINRTSCDGR